MICQHMHQALEQPFGTVTTYMSQGRTTYQGGSETRHSNNVLFHLFLSKKAFSPINSLSPPGERVGVRGIKRGIRSTLFTLTLSLSLAGRGNRSFNGPC